MVSFNPKKLWLALRNKFRRQKEVGQFQLREFIYLDEVSLQSLKLIQPLGKWGSAGGW